MYLVSGYAKIKINKQFYREWSGTVFMGVEFRPFQGRRCYFCGYPYCSNITNMIRAFESPCCNDCTYQIQQQIFARRSTIWHAYCQLRRQLLPEISIYIMQKYDEINKELN